MPTIDDLLLPTFLRQHWLVTIDDVIEVGGSSAHARDRLRSGRWERADHGVYHLVGTPLAWTSQVLAPILSARQDGVTVVASHRSAAALHGDPRLRTRTRGARHTAGLQPPTVGRPSANQR